MSDPRTWPLPPTCACDLCVGACHQKPGIYAPGEAAKTAKLLRVPLKRLFTEKLAVDYAHVGPKHRAVFVISPATVRITPGQVWPFGEPCGTCVFLMRDGRCGIHAAKPLECRLAHHDNESDGQDEHELIVKLWDTPAGRAEVRELYGSDPVAPKPTWTDAVKLTLPPMILNPNLTLASLLRKK